MEIPICISAVNRIINRTNAQNSWRTSMDMPRIELTGKRVQLLLYLCQLIWYIDHEECNMIPENFQAWPHGVTIPEIYNYFSVYQEGDLCPLPNTIYELSEEEVSVINKVVDNTTDISTDEIIDYIKLPNGPWAQNYQECQNFYNVISKDIIKIYIRTSEHQSELLDFIQKNTILKGTTLTRK